MYKAILFLIIVVSPMACSTTSTQTLEENHQKAADVNAQLAHAYILQGNKREGVAKLRKALELKPELPSTHHYIAETYRLLGQAALAESHYLKAIKLTPKDSLIQNNYGVFLCEQGRYEEAEKRFLVSVRNPLYATPEEAYENAALCALRIPDKERAEFYFRKAVEVHPLQARSLYQLALLEFEQKNYMRARAFLQRYEGVSEESPESLWLGLRIERYNGNQAVMAQYAKSLTEKFPSSQEAQW